MSITDNSGSLEAVVVGKVAERIMQTTPERISELAKMGETYNLSSVRSDFENKMFLMLLYQSAGKKAGIQRRPLLEAYYNETSNDKGKSTDNTLSPLKRQMNQMEIDPDSAVIQNPETGTQSN
ncbi:hypothetical protein LIER_11875 [Lithospermum erythrorhizon]|uniref:Uncharacterized protein n=1 Tax=Lithospermum erythrorhizon TaxID=34254 RepID=A0AAV3PRI1_LITER